MERAGGRCFCDLRQWCPYHSMIDMSWLDSAQMYTFTSATCMQQFIGINWLYSHTYDLRLCIQLYCDNPTGR